MNPQISKHFNFLSLFISGDGTQKLALLKTMTTQQYKILVECVYNVLYGVYRMTQKDKKKLAKHKDVIRRITDEGLTYMQRKRLLIRNHFILPVILKTILSESDDATSSEENSEAEL